MDQYVYMDILNKVLLPFTNDQMPENCILQADNDPEHTARRVKQFLNEQNINILPWPSQSPDLNSIEMLWTDVEKYIKHKRPKNVNELYAVIEEGWKKIPVERCHRLIDLMPHHCGKVIRQKGKATRY